MEEEIMEKDMTPILVEDLGMKYPTEKSKRPSRYGLFQCQYCGKEFEAHIQSIKSGNTKSCSCVRNSLISKANISHGLTKHPLYDMWSHMRDRCNNPKYKKYKDYGGRGILVCDRWLDVYNFIEDMYPSWEKGLSIDRIDVNGNYELDNCRWTTKEVQARNTRDIRTTNKSGFRGVSWHKRDKGWQSNISTNNKLIYLGTYSTSLEAAKAYERYVRLNNLEHNFTPALTEEEIEEINKQRANNE